MPGGESETISVQKNTWQGAGASCDLCLCLVVRESGRENGKNRDQSSNHLESVQPEWNINGISAILKNGQQYLLNF